VNIHSGFQRRSVAACVAALLGSTQLMAAETAADENALEEIVVTAQFREQNLQDTPIAITAVTGEMMELRNQTSIFQVAQQAPNVMLSPQGQSNGSGLLAFIRGVGQTDFNYALEPGVGMYIDDVYYATVTGSNFDLMDLERVEVLRGPQGTLAGRNSIGGAIKMYSKKPQGDGSGSVQLTYGDYDRVDARAVGDFALVEDKLFMRIAGATKSRDGFITRYDYKCTHPTSALQTLNVGTDCKLGTLGGQAFTAGRVSLRWLASEKVEVNIIGDITNDSSEAGASVLRRATNTMSGGAPLPPTDPRYVQQNGVPYGCAFVPWGPNSCDPNVAQNNPYMSYATFVDSLAPTTQRPFKPSVIPPIQQLDQWGLSANVNWEINENYALTWISSWREYDSSWAQDVDGSPLPSQQLLQTLNHRQWTQELRLNGQLFNDKLDFTLGGFYFDQEGTLQARVDLNYSGIDFIHGPDETPANSKAAFLHAEYHLTDDLSVIGGLRYTKDYKNYVYKRSNPDGTIPGPCPPGFPFAPTGVPNCVLTGLYNVSPPDPFRSDRTDWRLGINYRWSDSLMTYAQASTGYKGGGINPRPFYPWQILGFQPETLTTYEVGAKTDFLDGRMRLNAAVFFNDYKDIILTLSVCDVDGPPLTGAGQLAATPCALPSNVGKADVKGAEFEGNFRLGGGFSFEATASFLDFKYTEIDPVTGVNDTMITPYTPEEKYSAALMWQGDAGGRGTLTARMDYTYQSETQSAAINLPNTRIPPWGAYNARLSWNSPDDDWQASFELNNVTNKLYYLSNNDWSTNAGSTTFSPAMPRNWAITLKRNFN